MLHLVSTFVVLLIAAGLIARKHPRVHLRIMSAAFAVDLGLVLYIEVTRHAVERVVGPAGPLIWFHAAVSLLVLAAYAAQLIVGRGLLAGRSASRRVHMALGISFCVLRGVNYATAFMVSSASSAPIIRQAEAPATATLADADVRRAQE